MGEGGAANQSIQDGQGLKDPCSHMLGVGGQYKMYKSIIFINCEHNLCDISLVKHSEFL